MKLRTTCEERSILAINPFSPPALDLHLHNPLLELMSYHKL